MIDYLSVPYSLEAEQSVIGGILLNPEKAVDICEKLTSTDFYQADHQGLFRAIESLTAANQPCDVTTVINFLASHDLLEQTGGLPYLAELAENTPSSANINAYADIVMWRKRERDVIAMAHDMEREIRAESGTSEEKVNNAMAIVTNFDYEQEGEKSFADLNRELVQLLHEREAAKGGLTGITSGFKAFDERFNGLQKTDLIILAARPSQGKTTLALNIAQKVAETKPTIIFSMEMSGVQLTEKIWASAGCRLSSIKKGMFDNPEENSAMMRGAARAKELKLVIDDRPALTPQQVRAKCLRLKRKYGELGVVMIDYLQLMRVNKSQGRTEDTTQISNALKALAKELDCPVLVLSQLNRSVESRSGKKIPQMSDLRDSGAIEQDADIIMFVYRDDYYAEREGRESDEPNIARIITSKFRGGEVGVDYLKTELQYSRFRDLDQPFTPSEDNQKPEYRRTF